MKEIFYLHLFVFFVHCKMEYISRELSMEHGERITVGFLTNAEFKMGLRSSEHGRNLTTLGFRMHGTILRKVAVNSSHTVTDAVAFVNKHKERVRSIVNTTYCVSLQNGRRNSTDNELMVLVLNYDVGDVDIRNDGRLPARRTIVSPIGNAFLEYDDLQTKIYYWIRCKLIII